MRPGFGQRIKMLLVLGQRRDEHFTRVFESLGWRDGREYTILDRYCSPMVSLEPGQAADFLTGTRLIWPLIKPPLFEESFVPEGAEERNYFYSEWGVFDDYICSTIPKGAFIQSLGRRGPEENKIIQLSVAKKLGFNVPRSLISTDAEAVERFFERWPIVFKPLTSTPAGSKGALLTTKIHRNRLSELCLEASRCPGIFQEYIEKQSEWRINVFGTKVFAAELAASDTAGLSADWRLAHWRQGALKPVVIPMHVEKACLRFTKHFGLHHAVFDVALDAEGNTFFLECNPSGQYTFVEDQTGQPLSRAMANLISKIASKYSG